MTLEIASFLKYLHLVNALLFCGDSLSPHYYCAIGTGERKEKTKIGDTLIRHIHACYIEIERREERGERREERRERRVGLQAQ